MNRCVLQVAADPHWLQDLEPVQVSVSPRCSVSPGKQIFVLRAPLLPSVRGSSLHGCVGAPPRPPAPSSWAHHWLGCRQSQQWQQWTCAQACPDWNGVGRLKAFGRLPAQYGVVATCYLVVCQSVVWINCMADCQLSYGALGLQPPATRQRNWPWLRVRAAGFPSAHRRCVPFRRLHVRASESCHRGWNYSWSCDSSGCLVSLACWLSGCEARTRVNRVLLRHCSAPSHSCALRKSIAYLSRSCWLPLGQETTCWVNLVVWEKSVQTVQMAGTLHSSEAGLEPDIWARQQERRPNQRRALSHNLASLAWWLVGPCILVPP